MKTFFLFILILFITKLPAQELPKVNEIFSSVFLTKFNIVLNTGEIIENGSVLIENGIIKKFGNNLSNDGSSFLIDGKNQYLYPGFFDAGYLFKFQIPKNADTTKRTPGNPTYENSGITPQLFAVDFFHSERKNYEKLHSAGFTINLILPNLGMLSGKSGIVSLHKEKSANDFISIDAGLFARFSGARGFNPSTIMGLMAKYRQLFYDAEYYINKKSSFEKNQTERIAYDEVLEILNEVKTKKTILLFEANEENDIRRMLNLKKEFGFNIILIGGKDAYKVTNELKAENIPVILSLNFPEKQSDSLRVDSTKKDYTQFFIKEEIESLKERQKQARKDLINNAKVLKENGIKFAFASLGTKPEELKKNLLELKNEGYSEEEILNALTIYPAEIFNIKNKLGGIKEGLFASFFITDKPYFDKNSKVKAVIIDSVYYEIEQKQTTSAR